MSIERTPAGTWRVRWRDNDGRHKAKVFKRKGDATAYEHDTLVALRRGHYLDPKAATATITAAADEWLTNARNLGRGGHDTYRRDLDRYILPTLGTLPLNRLTANAINDYIASELAAGLAPSTVHRHYRTIRRLAAVAVLNGRLPANPCDHVHPPKLDTAPMRFLTADQVEALAGKIGARYKAWVLIAAYGGLRWSETVGLRRNHITGPRVTVVEQLVRRSDGTWDRTRPKTVAGRRLVMLPATVADVLAGHLDKHAGDGPDGLVFPNRNGDPLNVRSFTGNVYKPALRRAGIDQATRIHDLRHTAVALAILAGAHPKAIQARLGHASIAVTLDRYGHLFPVIDETLADRLDALRPPPAPT